VSDAGVGVGEGGRVVVGRGGSGGGGGGGARRRRRRSGEGTEAAPVVCPNRFQDCYRLLQRHGRVVGTAQSPI